MKKLSKILLTLFIITIIAIGGIKTFSNEDSWICSNGEWIAHGNPSTSKPTSPCDKFCVQDTDCQIPMEFLVQSNCPFGSACINSECKVVCPFYESECTTNADCNCDQRGTKTQDCICHKGSCVSIEG
jgi:hypothetical protein